MDDWQYLQAARCWLENGPCLPKDHWQGRWPVVAPLAVSIEMLGETRWAAGLPFLIMAVGILVLLWLLFARLASPRIGSIVTLLLVASPFFAVRLIQPNVEYPELLLLLACIHAILNYRDRGTLGWAALSGLFFGLAIQARETAVVALPILLFLAWKWARHDWRALALAAAFAAIPTLVEFAIFAMETGNPFYRRTLSVSHTSILSSELKVPPDASATPFFNPYFIANWKHEPGLSVHWTIDGLVNLFLNPLAGVSLLLNLLLLPVTWKHLAPKVREAIKIAALIAIYWACVIIYAFAIDPNPRMLVVPIIASHFVLALQLVALRRAGMQLLGAVVLGTIIVAGLVLSLSPSGTQHIERDLERIFRDYEGRLEADYNTRKQITLIRGAETAVSINADRPYLMIQMVDTCQSWADEYLAGRVRIVEDLVMNQLRYAIRPDSGHFCLVEYLEPVPPRDVILARFPNLPEAAAKEGAPLIL